MRKTLLSSSVLLTALLFTAPGWADSPPDILTLDSHSLEVTGNISRYRVQIEGMEFGRDKHASDAEVMVTLNNDDSKVYTVRLHGDSPPINKVIADTLRDAFLSNSKVTLYHQKSSSVNLKIHMVQIQH